MALVAIQEPSILKIIPSQNCRNNVAINAIKTTTPVMLTTAPNNQLLMLFAPTPGIKMGSESKAMTMPLMIINMISKKVGSCTFTTTSKLTIRASANKISSICRLRLRF